MSRHGRSSAVNAVLESGKQLPEQPASVRARVMARAREAALVPAVAPVSLAPPRQWFVTRVLVPSAAVAIGASGAGYAWSVRSQPTHDAPRVVRVASDVTATAPVAPAAAPPPMTVGAPKASSAVAAGVASSRRSGSARESFEAEFDLLRSAHTAYASHDYAGALVLVAEHSRRFPHGGLAEEREALRVRCLVASGRSAEARRAASSFAARFPRSVLLSQMQALVGGTGE